MKTLLKIILIGAIAGQAYFWISKIAEPPHHRTGQIARQ